MLQLPGMVQAQSFPSRPIRFIVSTTAGSGTDVLARTVADKLSLGQSVIVENRVGAGGAVGSTFVARSTPDGYTLLVSSSALTAAPAIYSNLSYDPIGDFAGVTPIGELGTALVAAPSKGFRTVQDLVARAKANPGQLAYASAGIGSASHMTTEQFRTAAGFVGVHVPYRGALEALTDVITGRVDFMTAPLAAALPLIQDSKLVALAVPSTYRSSLLPNVPTIGEAGIASASYYSWVGVLAPKATPREIIDRLHRAIVLALALPEVKAQFAATGSDVRSMTPDAFDALIKDEVAANKALARAVGIKASP
jgi:tripartite-type tricarboxylate transporter receptor subunit TctC